MTYIRREPISVVFDVPVTLLQSPKQHRCDSITSLSSNRRRRDDVCEDRGSNIGGGMGSSEGGMTESAEALFKEWDAADLRSPVRTNVTESDGRPLLSTDLSSSSPSYDAEESLDLLTGSGSGMSVARLRPLYIDCDSSLAGSRRLFRVEFDAEEYASGDIVARVSAERRLIVRGERHEVGMSNGRQSATTFCRRIMLPDDVDVSRLTCHHLGDKILIEAPALTRTSATSPRREEPRRVDSPGLASVLPTVGRLSHGSHRGSTSFSESPADLLNVATIQTVENVGGGVGQLLCLPVEVGSFFGPDDVLVKLKSRSKLVVTAEHREEAPGGVSKMLANLLREFDLPTEIDPESLTAELFPNSILRITATVSSSTP